MCFLNQPYLIQVSCLADTLTGEEKQNKLEGRLSPDLSEVRLGWATLRSEVPEIDERSNYTQILHKTAALFHISTKEVSLSHATKINNTPKNY